MNPADVLRSVSQAGLSPVFETPADYGLDYTDVTFTSDDGVELSGWWIPGSNGKVVVQTHFGGVSSKAGYTPDGKGRVAPWPEPIHYLRHIQVLVEHGYTVLAYDMRNHGDSGPDPAGKLTSGVRESSDVIAAVRFATEHAATVEAPVGLLSLCMGANATTYAFGRDDGLATIPNIGALVAVQPLDATDQLHAMGVPDVLIDPASAINQATGGVDLRSSFLPAVAGIHVPTLLVQNTNDPMVNKDSIRAYYDRLPASKEMVWLDLAPARLAAYDHFPNHPDDLVAFFDTHL